MNAKLRIAAAAAGAVAACVAAAPAADGPEVRRLFPRQAEVTVDGPGLSRLVLPAEVLAACRADLSDLRLFDHEDREVAFLVDRGVEPGSAVESSQRFMPPVLDVERTQVRGPDRAPVWKESIDLGLPDTAPQTGNWVLVLENAPAEFVAGVDVMALGDGDRREPLVDGASLFRLRGPRSVEKLRLPLPPFEGERIRVTLRTERSGWLNASFRLESARTLERGERIAVPLETTSIRHEQGTTVVSLARPAGIVPDLLRIETTTGTFDRAVRVWDEGPGSATGPLGSGSVFRVDAGTPVGETEVDLAPARGDALRVEIDDGDSPPLESPSFAAEVRQPSLVFSLPAGEPGATAGILRFGGGRAHRPRYDLAGLLPDRTTTGARAEAAARLFDPSLVRTARLGPSGPNLLYDRTPALAFAMRAGAEIDAAAFGHLRRLRVPSAPEGLSRLRLAPADLALLKEDLSDLRVADGESRQWPYLVEPAAATELVSFRIEGPETEDSESRYELIPPAEPIRVHRLVLDADVPFFDRPFRIAARLPDGESRTLLRGRLVRPAGDPRPVDLDLPVERVRSLELVVEDGDDAPLPLESVQGAVRLPDLFLTAREGEYNLLLGAPGESAPRYELERVRDVVLAVKAAPIEAGALEPNPAVGIGARLRGTGLGQRVLLWGVLVAAVLVLGGLTLRLARRESGA